MNTSKEEERRERRAERKVVRVLEIRACCFSSYSQIHLILEISLMANGEVILYQCLPEITLRSSTWALRYCRNWVAALAMIQSPTANLYKSLGRVHIQLSETHSPSQILFMTYKGWRVTTLSPLAVKLHKGRKKWMIQFIIMWEKKNLLIYCLNRACKKRDNGENFLGEQVKGNKMFTCFGQEHSTSKRATCS